MFLIKLMVLVWTDCYQDTNIIFACPRLLETQNKMFSTFLVAEIVEKKLPLRRHNSH